MEGIPTNYLVLVLTSYQWPYLRVIALWEDMLKECGSHLTISVVVVNPLRKKRLLSTFFINVRLLLGVNIDYLAPISCQQDGAMVY